MYLLLLSFSAHARTTSWNISRQWNETEENLYSEFVYKIGKRFEVDSVELLMIASEATSLTQCLRVKILMD